MALQALAFDVFGTVVDWRSTVSRESGPYLAKIGRSDIDLDCFADGWRARYISTLLTYRESGRKFVVLDVLHREMLEDWLRELKIDPGAFSEAELGNWTKIWHRLDPWPDSAEGLTRLKARYPIVTLSNGNVALMIAMAKHANLPWDAILGAEFTRSYKPDPATYTGTVAALGLELQEVCLVAAHHADLAVARSLGMLTAYVDRPLEYGGAPHPDIAAAQAWDHAADSMISLAAQLGC